MGWSTSLNPDPPTITYSFITYITFISIVYICVHDSHKYSYKLPLLNYYYLYLTSIIYIYIYTYCYIYIPYIYDGFNSFPTRPSPPPPWARAPWALAPRAAPSPPALRRRQARPRRRGRGAAEGMGKMGDEQAMNGGYDYIYIYIWLGMLRYPISIDIFVGYGNMKMVDLAPYNQQQLG